MFIKVNSRVFFPLEKINKIMSQDLYKKLTRKCDGFTINNILNTYPVLYKKKMYIYNYRTLKINEKSWYR